MEFRDLTIEQRDARQKIWVGILNEYCPPVYEDGTRKCDLGMICDSCHYNFDLLLKFARKLNDLGVPLVRQQIEEFGEYL